MALDFHCICRPLGIMQTPASAMIKKTPAFCLVAGNASEYAPIDLYTPPQMAIC